MLITPKLVDRAEKCDICSGGTFMNSLCAEHLNGWSEYLAVYEKDIEKIINARILALNKDIMSQIRNFYG